VSQLAGRTAIVTGGGQGVGYGIARAFAGAGANLVLTGRTPVTLDTAAERLRCETAAQVLTVPGDTGLRDTAPKTVAATLERFGSVDILVNGAFTMTPGVMLADTTDEIWNANLLPGLHGCFWFMQAAFAALKANGRGAVINLCSGYGIMSPPGFGAYAAAKEGLRGLSRVAAREWAPLGIRVNVLNPVALSPPGERFIAENPGYKEMIEAQIAMRRIGDAVADIGPVALFLAGDEARYVTGQTLHADGGMVML
jgi:NAD(P)-dependent dehydrogenase (short-subunit alcohol dehydrogenase family)